jgi:hypothetical protein
MNSYDQYVRRIAKHHGFTEEGDLILWGAVEKWANQAVHELSIGVSPGFKGETAILLMALREEEES